ncbi:MAG: hypothetical protein H7234_06420 [Herminiimonas sp.]|nr:hypothetical protein [Herminiimonas sp.]
MLTATYSLVAMAAEQSTTYDFLARTRQAVTVLWTNIHTIELERAHLALLGLRRFDHYCRQRKVERFVIPAVRGSCREIDAIVSDLDCLSGVGMQLLGTAAAKLGWTLEQRASHLTELCRTMESYCECLEQRLRREEEELLPIVRRMFSVDDWFSLAAQFLGDEKVRRAGATS